MDDDRNTPARHEEPNDTPQEVFDNGRKGNDGFETQNRRGFAGNNNGNGTGDGQPRNSKQSWRNRVPNVMGSGERTNSAAPVDLFVYGVSNEASGEQIVTYMKDSKGLEITE